MKSHGPDLLIAGDEGDKLVGRGGDDCLIGGMGNDRLAGGPGNDIGISCEREKRIQSLD